MAEDLDATGRPAPVAASDPEAVAVVWVSPAHVRTVVDLMRERLQPGALAGLSQPEEVRDVVIVNFGGGDVYVVGPDGSIATAADVAGW